jgi:hypothetical protein
VQPKLSFGHQLLTFVPKKDSETFKNAVEWRQFINANVIKSSPYKVLNLVRVLPFRHQLLTFVPKKDSGTYKNAVEWRQFGLHP